MSHDIKSFKIDIPQSQLDDLKSRLANTRWPEKETVSDWEQGAPLAEVQSLCEYWQNGYDWRRCEKLLNSYDHFITNIDGLDIHFMHIRSPHENATPMIMTHGWPGSVIEFMKVIEPLTNPEAHGGSAQDAFHLVIPSLPGFGFSGRPSTTGWNPQKIAEAWVELMKRLGYQQFVSQGGDWGAIVTTALGLLNPPECTAIHLNMPLAPPQESDFADLTPEEKIGVDKITYYQTTDSAYAFQQRTRPQSIGYALVDSPTALAAWIYEKFYFWTDNPGKPEDVLTQDEMLDNIMLYWLTATGASSARLYWEAGGLMSAPPLELPVGASVFPGDLFRPSRRWAERAYKNLIYWNQVEKGGHFAAFEQPEIFVQELRNFAKTL